MAVNITVNHFQIINTCSSDPTGQKYTAHYCSCEGKDIYGKQCLSDFDLRKYGREDTGFKQKFSGKDCYGNELLNGNCKSDGKPCKSCLKHSSKEISQEELSGVDLAEEQISSISTEFGENIEGKESNSNKNDDEVSAMKTKNQNSFASNIMTYDDAIRKKTIRAKNGAVAFQETKTQDLCCASYLESTEENTENYYENNSIDFEESDVESSIQDTKPSVITESTENICEDETNPNLADGVKSATDNARISNPSKMINACMSGFAVDGANKVVDLAQTTLKEINANRNISGFENDNEEYKPTETKTPTSSSLSEFSKLETLLKKGDNGDIDYQNTFIRSQQIPETNIVCKIKSSQTKGTPLAPCNLATNKKQVVETYQDESCSKDHEKILDVRPKQMLQIPVDRIESFLANSSEFKSPIIDNVTITDLGKKEKELLEAKAKQCPRSIVTVPKVTHAFSKTAVSFENKRKYKFSAPKNKRKSTVTSRDTLVPKKIRTMGILTKEHCRWIGAKAGQYLKRILFLDVRSPFEGKRITWPSPGLIITVLSLFTFFAPSVSQQMYDQPLAVLNSTAMTFSACTVPPKECPDSDDDKDLHMSCISLTGGCKEGFYFCDVTPDGWLVEGCFERNMCDKGMTNRIDFAINSLEAKLMCRVCPKGCIEQYGHDSMDSFRPDNNILDCSNMKDVADDKQRCRAQSVSLYIHNNIHKMKKVQDGYPTKPDLYICDTSQGYSNEYGSSLCSTEKDCFCVKTVKCTEDKPELLPNGSCDHICFVPRNISDDFSCSQYFPNATTKEKMVITEEITTHKPSKDLTREITKKQPGVTNPVISPVITIVVTVTCVVVLFPILSLLAFLVYRKWCRDERADRGLGTIEEHNIKCKTYAKSKNMTINITNISPAEQKKYSKLEQTDNDSGKSAGVEDADSSREIVYEPPPTTVCEKKQANKMASRKQKKYSKLEQTDNDSGKSAGVEDADSSREIVYEPPPTTVCEKKQ